MTYPKEIIAKTLHLYVEGLSLSKTRDYINQHEGYYLYDGTILYWVKKYANLLSKFESNLKSKVKKTKYNLATTFTKRRSKQKCRTHFKKLKNKIGDQVKEIWEKEKDHFYRIAKLTFGVPD